MKHLLYFICCCPLLVFGQCPPTGGVFTSQAQIDAFATDYPNCTQVGGFIISGDDITDLSGLYQINSCTGISISDNLLLENTIGLNPNLEIRYVEGTGTYFRIDNNPSLLTVDGFQNLNDQTGFESVLSVSDNPLLTSLVGLPNSMNALSLMSISNNDSLINLIGLGQLAGFEYTTIQDNDGLIDLQGIGDLTSERLTIRNNNNLQSLDGAEQTFFFDILTIEDNQNLTDISGIYAGNWLIWDLVIRNNPNLSMCSSENICLFFNDIVLEHEMLRGTFENNAPGCNSVFEAELGCGINTNDEPGYGGGWSLGETITAHNAFATTSSEIPTCNDVAGRKDVWFSYFANEDLNVDFIIESGFYMQLWEGSPFLTLTPVPNACGTELLDVPIVANNEYFLQVWNDDTADRADSWWFDLNIQDSSLSTPEFAINDVKVFPNPVNDILNIESVEAIEKIEVFNLLGQSVIVSNSALVDFSSFSKGMYLVQVSAEGKESTFKVLKD